MQYPYLLFALLASLSSLVPACAQDQVEQCALDCVSNVNGTGCAVSNWPCLCNSTLYIDRLNSCIYKVCNTTQGQQATFQAIAEICDIFNEPLTASPEATIPASLLTAGNATAVSIAIPTSISSEPVTSTSPAMSTGMNTLAPTSSTTSETGAVTGSSESSSASATAAQSTGRAAAVSYSTGLYVAAAMFGLAASFVL